MLSPYDYWQFWRNTSDADVGRFLRLFTTTLPLDEIARLERLAGQEINEAKKVLANEATKLCHGEEAVSIAETTAQSVFLKGKSSVLKIEGHSGLLNTGLPVVEISSEELYGGIALYELIRRAGLTGSNGEARRHINGGGARLNDESIVDEARTLGPDDLTDGVAKLSVGKKRHALVRVA
jgi:tyrosyl-tRNA synthetase